MAVYKIDNRPAPIDFELTGDAARTLQNAKNLLMTRKGELPYGRNRGFDRALFDLPFPKFLDALMPELDRIMLWEPDAEVVDADAWLDENGETVIEVYLEIDA